MADDARTARTRRTTKPTAPPPRRAYRAAGRERQKEETRARILDSAIKLFSERGFEAASVRDITDEAGVTHAVIRLHFGSKDRLWRAALDRLFERQREETGGNGFTVEQIAKATPDLLREGILRYVRYCARHPEHVRMMVQESLRDSDRVRWLATTHVRHLQRPFVRCFERASKEDRRAALSIPSLVYGLVAASQMVFALAAEARHVYGVDVNDPEFVEAHAETVFRMLTGAFAPGPAPTATKQARASTASTASTRPPPKHR